jgi:hypothetical protein
MRTLQSLIVAHLVLTCVAVATAQDQFFRVNMNGPSALPSNNSREVGDGFFTLSSNLFLGGAGPIDGRLTPTVLRIQHASGRLIFETREIEYRIPYPEEDYAYYIAYRSFGVGLVLTSNLMDEVVQGQWYVTIASEQYPNGEIRGTGSLIPLQSWPLEIPLQRTDGYLMERTFRVQLQQSLQSQI